MEAMDVEKSEEFQKGLVFGTTIKQSKRILYKYTTYNVCPRKRHEGTNLMKYLHDLCGKKNYKISGFLLKKAYLIREIKLTKWTGRPNIYNVYFPPLKSKSQQVDPKICTRTPQQHDS